MVKETPQMTERNIKDLSHLNVVKASEKGMKVPLMGPDGQPTGLNIGMMGFDADKIVKASREFDKDAADNPRKDEHPDDFAARRRAYIVAAAVTNWDGLALDGVEITQENAASFLENRGYSWITTGLFNRGSMRANFFAKESES